MTGTVNVATYVEISVPADQIAPDPNSEEGEALLRVPISQAKELARRISLAAEEATKKAKRK